MRQDFAQWYQGPEGGLPVIMAVMSEKNRSIFPFISTVRQHACLIPHRSFLSKA